MCISMYILGWEQTGNIFFANPSLWFLSPRDLNEDCQFPKFKIALFLSLLIEKYHSSIVSWEKKAWLSILLVQGINLKA